MYLTDVRAVGSCRYHRERDELVHILLNLVESSILSVGPIPEDLKEYHPDVPDESA